MNETNYKDTNQDTKENISNHLQGKKALDKLLLGFYGVADAVRATIGSKGKNSLIRDIRPFITNDGKTIVRTINCKDPYAQQGVEVLRDIVARSIDGTTTTVILSQAIMKEGLATGLNDMTLKVSLDEAKEKALAILEDISIKCNDEYLQNVATISADSPKYGKMISDIYKELGENAHIEISTNFEGKEQVEKIEGIEIYAGYASEAFKTNEYNSTLENPYVLVTTDHFVVADLIPLLEKITVTKRPLIMVTKEVSQETIRTFASNHLISLGLIKAEGSGLKCLIVRDSLAKEHFEDCAKAFGTQVINQSSGKKLKDITIEDLGTAERVTTDDKSMRIIGGKDLTEYVNSEESRLKHLGKLDAIQKRRLGGLTSKMAKMNISSPNEQDLAYWKMKVEDSISTTKKAMQSGVIPGGGVGLKQIADKLTGDSLGEQVLKKALIYPLKQIIENSGNNPYKIIPQLKGNQGFNTNTETIEPDLLQAGIVDCTEVTKNAIINSVACVSTLLTIDSIIV